MFKRIRCVAALLLCAFLAGCMPEFPDITYLPDTPEDRLAHAKEQLQAQRHPFARELYLEEAAKLSFELGNIEDARKYALELKALSRRLWIFPPFYLDGAAVHDSNMVLGRIAVHEGRIEDAKAYLLEAGTTSGSATLNSFGPNMSLAKDLLKKGEREVVLQYFELCRKFWEMGHERLDAWSRQVKAGEIPDFGANLVY